MKLTNGEIFRAKEPLKKLMDERMPVKVSYGLAKIANKLNVQLMIIENVREGLVKTYGKPDERNPSTFRVDPVGDNYLKFIEEVDELMAQEVEIVIEEVTLPDTLEIEPSILMALDKFIKI